MPIKHNPPAVAGRVVKAWRVAYDEIPDCSLKREALAGIAAFAEDPAKGFSDDLRKAFLRGFAEPFAKPFENPSRIQEEFADCTLAKAGATLKSAAARVERKEREQAARRAERAAVERPEAMSAAELRAMFEGRRGGAGGLSCGGA